MFPDYYPQYGFSYAPSAWGPMFPAPWPPIPPGPYCFPTWNYYLPPLSGYPFNHSQTTSIPPKPRVKKAKANQVLSSNGKEFLLEKLSNRLRWESRRSQNHITCSVRESLSSFLLSAKLYSDILGESPFFEEPSIIIRGSFASLLLLLEEFEGDLKKALKTLGGRPEDLDVTIPLKNPPPGTDPFLYLQFAMAFREDLIEKLCSGQELPQNFLRIPTYIYPKDEKEVSCWALDRWHGIPKEGGLNVDLQITVQNPRPFSDLRGAVEVHVPCSFLEKGTGEVIFRSANRNLPQNKKALLNNQLLIPKPETLENGLAILARGITEGRVIGERKMLQLCEIFSEQLKKEHNINLKAKGNGLFQLESSIHSHWPRKGDVEVQLAGLVCLSNSFLAYHPEGPSDSVSLSLSNAFFNRAFIILEKCLYGKNWKDSDPRKILLVILQLIEHTFFKLGEGNGSWRQIFSIGEKDVYILRPPKQRLREISLGHIVPENWVSKDLRDSLQNEEKPVQHFTHSLLSCGRVETLSLAIDLGVQGALLFSSEEEQGEYLKKAIDQSLAQGEVELASQAFFHLLNLGLEDMESRLSIALNILEKGWNTPCFQLIQSALIKGELSDLNVQSIQDAISNLLQKYGEQAKSIIPVLLNRRIFLPHAFLEGLTKKQSWEALGGLFIQALPQFEQQLSHSPPTWLVALGKHHGLTSTPLSLASVFEALKTAAIVDRNFGLCFQIFNYLISKDKLEAFQYLQGAWSSFHTHGEYLKGMLKRLLLLAPEKGKVKIKNIQLERVSLENTSALVEKLDFNNFLQCPWPYLTSFHFQKAKLSTEPKTFDLSADMALKFLNSWIDSQGEKAWTGEDLWRCFEALPLNLENKSTTRSFFGKFLFEFEGKIFEKIRNGDPPSVIWKELNRFREIRKLVVRRKLLPPKPKAYSGQTTSVLIGLGGKQDGRFFVDALLHFQKNPPSQRSALVEELFTQGHQEKGPILQALTDYTNSLDHWTIPKNGPDAEFKFLCFLHFASPPIFLAFLGSALKPGKATETYSPLLKNLIVQYWEQILTAMDGAGTSTITTSTALGLSEAILAIWKENPIRCVGSIQKLNNALLPEPKYLKLFWEGLLPDLGKPFPTDSHEQAITEVLQEPLVQLKVVPTLTGGEKDQLSDFMERLCRVSFLVVILNFPRMPESWIRLAQALMLPQEDGTPGLYSLPNEILLIFLESLIENQYYKEASFFFSATIQSLFWSPEVKNMQPPVQKERFLRTQKLNESIMLGCAKADNFMHTWNALQDCTFLAARYALPANADIVLEVLRSLPPWDQEDPNIRLPEERDLLPFGFSSLFNAAKEDPNLNEEKRRQLLKECLRGIDAYPIHSKSQAWMLDIYFFAKDLANKTLGFSPDEQRRMASHLLETSVYRIPDKRFPQRDAPAVPSKLRKILDQLIPLNERTEREHAAWMVFLAKTDGKGAVETYWQTLKAISPDCQQAYFAARVLALGTKIERMYISKIIKRPKNQPLTLPRSGARKCSEELEVQTLALRKEIEIILNITGTTPKLEKEEDLLYFFLTHMYGSYALLINFTKNRNLKVINPTMDVLRYFTNESTPLWILSELIPLMSRSLECCEITIKRMKQKVQTEAETMHKFESLWLSSTKAFPFKDFLSSSLLQEPAASTKAQ